MVTHSVVDDAGLLEVIDTSATLDLHRSNLLRLQISELLEECQLDLENKRWSVATQEYFQHLSSIIGRVSVAEKDFQELADKPVSVELRLSGQVRLSMEPIGCTKARFGWTKKSGNAQVLPTFDFMIQIPLKVFSAKDYMHYRYFDKRNVIMNRVAETLLKAEKVGTVKLVWINGSNRPPLLRLHPPNGKKAPKFQVHLHFGMESIDWIPKLRLVPNRSNVKEEGAKAQFYNHCLMYDARHRFEDAHVQQLFDHKSCQEALVLLQVWALQRGLWRNHDGWDKTSVALLMVYLLRTHKMNPRMTAIQLFTVVLQTWATTNWLGEKERKNQTLHAAQGQRIETQLEARERTILVLPEDGESESETVRSAHLCKMYAKHTEESPLSTDDPPTLLDAYAWTNRYLLGPVFMDPSMSYNYLGGVSYNYMQLLSWHARKSLEALNNSRSAFDILFMQRTRFWQQWDLYVRVPTSYKTSGEDWEFSVRRLLHKLEMGLGNRVHGMRVLSNGNGEFSGSTPDTDQYIEESADMQRQLRKHWLRSPTGTDDIIVGVSIDQETSQRVVDRGPPTEQHDEVQHFLDLWGKKAQLRRFKDGAIVQAVVWNEDKDVGFHNGGKWNGGYVEKILRHLVHVHHAKLKVVFSFPNFLSTIDDITSQDNLSAPSWDPLSAHQRLLKAFESLSDFLRRHTEQPTPGHLQTSSLGLPLSIDAVEALSPALRYSELFPPHPHPLLGGAPNAEKRVSGAIMFDPILVQIRFGASSKWPTDLKAIGAAKTAMLIQLANGIEKSGGKGFDGVINVSPSYLDCGYLGYCFRIIVRADPEIHMLQRLVTPSPAAKQLLKDLTQRHLLASRHHSTIHAVHTLHPSAAPVVRLARRWAASHLLSGHLTTEMIELLVASVYSDDSVFVQPPATVPAGFLRFLRLLATYDWAREPLVINPRGHISGEECDEIFQAFERCRGQAKDSGPPMYVIAAYNRDTGELDGQNDEQEASSAENNEKWNPSVASPEWVVLSRAVYLAKRSHEYMHSCLSNFDDASWCSIFHETPNSFKSYSVLMRVGGDFIVDHETSSTGGKLDVTRSTDGLLQSSFTRSMKARNLGPKCLRQKVYRNLRTGNSAVVIPTWQPIQDLVESLRNRFGDYAIFFYNEFCPEVIGIAWRPQVFVQGSFSAMSSEHSCPVTDDWTVDTLVSRNVGDLVREITQYGKNIATSVRIFDETCLSHFNKKQKISQQKDG